MNERAAGTDAVASGRRPLVVTLAVVLVYGSALTSVVLGVLILLARYDVAESAVLAISLLGVGVTLFGLLVLAGASGLARGSRLARILLSAYFGAEALLQIITIATTDDWDVTSTFQVLAIAFILVVVWTPPGSRHFRRDVALDPPLIPDAAPDAATDSVART